MNWELFERELDYLQGEMLTMARMVEDAITGSVENLRQRNVEESRRLIAQDYTLDQKRFGIEADCLFAIAIQQPMNDDLRTLAAILSIAAELERIGDYTRDIARVSLALDPDLVLDLPGDLHRMAEQTRGMLHQALDAFVRRDVPLALTIPVQDDVVDGLYDVVYRQLLSCALSEPATVEQVNHLLWATHSLERAADQVAHICERVVFTVTGDMAEINGSVAVLQGRGGT